MIGLPRVHQRVIDSTNRRARELAAAGAPLGTIVTADEQTAGRGRQGRSWVAPPGSALLLSAVLRGLGEHAAMLPLATALAVAEACEVLAPVRADIKWPNDVWIERRKVAGILVEGRPQEDWAVVGIGLNVATREFPPELAEIATSLALAAADDGLSVAAALDELLPALEQWLEEEPDAIVEAWRERDALAGERVRWSSGAGVADGIDEAGALLVRSDDGERLALSAGEVHLLR